MERNQLKVIESTLSSIRTERDRQTGKESRKGRKRHPWDLNKRRKGSGDAGQHWAMAVVVMYGSGIGVALVEATR